MTALLQERVVNFTRKSNLSITSDQCRTVRIGGIHYWEGDLSFELYMPRAWLAENNLAHDDIILEASFVKEWTEVRHDTVLERTHYATPTEHDVKYCVKVREFEITSPVWQDVAKTVCVEENEIGDFDYSDVFDKVVSIFGDKSFTVE